MQPTAIGDCRHADDRCSEQGDSTSVRAVVGAIPDKVSKLTTSYQTVILQMGLLHGEVEMDNQQHTQFDPGESD